MSARRTQAIVALDVPSLTEARSLLDRVGPGAEFVKVGLELYAAEGPKVVEWLMESGRRVFFSVIRSDGSHITASPAANRGAPRCRTAMLGSARSTVCSRLLRCRRERLAAD